MSPQEIMKRRAIKVADAINNIEGVSVSKYAVELSEKRAQGDITSSQMMEKLLQIHRKD